MIINSVICNLICVWTSFCNSGHFYIKNTSNSQSLIYVCSQQGELSNQATRKLVTDSPPTLCTRRRKAAPTTVPPTAHVYPRVPSHAVSNKCPSLGIHGCTCSSSNRVQSVPDSLKELVAAASVAFRQVFRTGHETVFKSVRRKAICCLSPFGDIIFYWGYSVLLPATV